MKSARGVAFHITAYNFLRVEQNNMQIATKVPKYNGRNTVN